MNIIEQGQRFGQSLQELLGRMVWQWRHCPHCDSTHTCRNGSYTRHPWFFEGRRDVRVQRHLCHDCGRTYAEQLAVLVRGSWCAREVHRWAIDHWLHARSSLRRTAEWTRSWLGRQERWYRWRPSDGVSMGPRCYLAASTAHRWLHGAGRTAQQSIAGQLEGVPISRQLGTDGLWARLRGEDKQVVLLVADSVSGVIWPPVVVAGEEGEEPWTESRFGGAAGACFLAVGYLPQL